MSSTQNSQLESRRVSKDIDQLQENSFGQKLRLGGGTNGVSDGSPCIQTDVRSVEPNLANQFHLVTQSGETKHEMGTGQFQSNDVNDRGHLVNTGTFPSEIQSPDTRKAGTKSNTPREALTTRPKPVPIYEEAGEGQEDCPNYVIAVDELPERRSHHVKPHPQFNQPLPEAERLASVNTFVAQPTASALAASPAKVSKPSDQGSGRESANVERGDSSPSPVRAASDANQGNSNADNLESGGPTIQVEIQSAVDNTAHRGRLHAHVAPTALSPDPKQYPHDADDETSPEQSDTNPPIDKQYAARNRAELPGTRDGVTPLPVNKKRKKKVKKSKSTAAVLSRDRSLDLENSGETDQDEQPHMFGDQQSSVQFEQAHMPEARLGTNGDEKTQDQEEAKVHQRQGSSLESSKVHINLKSSIGTFGRESQITQQRQSDGPQEQKLDDSGSERGADSMKKVLAANEQQAKANTIKNVRMRNDGQSIKANNFVSSTIPSNNTPSILKEKGLDFKKSRMDRQISDNLLVPSGPHSKLLLPKCRNTTEKHQKRVQIRVAPVHQDSNEAYANFQEGKSSVKFDSPRTATMQQQYLQRRRTGGIDNKTTKHDMRFILSNDELAQDGGSLLGGGILSRIQNESLIEEEMSFDELSSRLGGLQPNVDDRSDRSLPFQALNSSAKISVVSYCSEASTAKASSVDFASIPVLLGPLGNSDFNCCTDRPRFDYHLRGYNHKSVDKMTYSNQAYLTQKRDVFQNGADSFAGNNELRFDRPNQTDDSQNIQPPIFGRLFNQNFHKTERIDSQAASPFKQGVENVPILKGMESFLERTDLYENFDIYHNDVSYCDSSSDDEIRKAFGSVYTAAHTAIQTTELDDKAKEDKAFADTISQTRNNEEGRLHELSTNVLSSKYATVSRAGNNNTASGSNLRETQGTQSHLSKKKKKKYDLRRESGPSAADKLMMILDQAQPGSTILLPAKEIQMPDLKIKKAFKIRGQPGTCLFFKQTTLTFEFNASEQKEKSERDFKSMEACIFSEVQLCFWIDMRDIAYRKGNAARYSPSKANHHQSRSLVPLIMIASGAKVEFRDCGFRAVKVFTKSKQGKEHEKSLVTKKSQNSTRNRDRSISSMKKAKNDQTNSNRQDSMSIAPSALDNDGGSVSNMQSGRVLGKYFATEKEEEQVLRENIHEVCFWMNGEAMSENSSILNEFSDQKQFLNKTRRRSYNASVFLQSCVLTGFYNQVRAGCNATVEIEKCYLSDSMSSALMLVNPRFFRMSESNLIRTQINSGLNIRWLSDSIDKHISRIIDISQNDFGLNYYCGIEIQGNYYSAHNIKVNISRNFIYRNKKEGVFVAQLALSAVNISGNEFQKNEGDNLKLQSLHHKVNKRYVFRVENCQLEQSKGGFGANVFDSSFVFKNCVVKGNQSGGIFVGCAEKPNGLMPEAIQFLKKYPMSVKLSDCKVTQNMHYGVLVQDFWKGSVIIKRTEVSYNCNFGIYLHQKERPEPSKQDYEQAWSIDKAAAMEASALAKNARRGGANAATSPFNMNLSQTSMIFSTQINKLKRGATSTLLQTALPSTAPGKSRDALPLGRAMNGGATPVHQDEAGKGSVPGQMEEIRLGIGDTANSKMEKVKKMAIPDGELQIIKLARVKPPEPAEGTVNNIMVMEVSDNGHGPITPAATHQNMETEDREPQSTMRNLLSKEAGDTINYNPGGGISPAQQEVSLGASRLSRLQSESPVKKNTSFASSILQSLRRRKRPSQERMGQGQIETYEVSRQVYLQAIQQIEIRLIEEQQELGKVYLTMGTEIVKNGGAGVAVRHCYLEIDQDPKTKILDNDFGFQVYVMLKQCAVLLSGFDQAMSEKRIRGRKVLVGGGWGQVTPDMPMRCCGSMQLKCLKPCMEGIRSACGMQPRGQQSRRSNRVMPAKSSESNLPVYASPSKHKQQANAFDDAQMNGSPLPKVRSGPADGGPQRDLDNISPSPLSIGHQQETLSRKRNAQPLDAKEEEHSVKCSIF